VTGPNLLAEFLLLAAIFAPAIAIIIGVFYVLLPQRKPPTVQPAAREATAHR
jgi:hypothetical protein